MHSRWRTFLTLVVATGVALVTVALVVVRHPYVKGQIIAAIERAVHESTGLTVAIADFQVTVIPLGVRATNAVVISEIRTSPIVKAKQLRVEILPWPSRRGHLVISKLHIDGLYSRIDAHELRLLRERLTKDKQDDSTAPVDLRAVFLNHATITFSNDALELDLRHVDLAIERTQVDWHTVSVSIADGKLTTLTRAPINFSMSTAGALRGKIESISHAHVHKLNLSVPGMRAELQSDIGLMPPFELGMKAKVDGALDAVQPLVGNRIRLPKLEGNFDAQIDLRGSVATPTARVTATIADLNVAGQRIGQVEFDSVNSFNEVRVESLRITHPEAGMITGSGQIETAPPWAFALTTRLHEVSLPHALESAFLPNAWVKMIINGDVSGRGAVQNFGMQLDADLDIHDFHSLNQSYRSPSAVSLFGLPHARIRGPWRISQRGVHLDGVQIAVEKSALDVEGVLWFDRQTSYELRAFGYRVDLHNLSPVAGVALAGSGPIALTIEGPYDDPTISGTLEPSALQIMNYKLGDADGTLVYKNGVLNASRVTLHPKLGGHIDADGYLDFTRTKGTGWSFNFALHDVTADEVLQGGGVDSALGKRLHARVSGSASLDGLITEPMGHLSLSTDELKIDDVLVGRVTVEGGIGDDETAQAWIEVDATNDTSRGHLRAALSKEDTFVAEGRFEQVDLQSISPFVARVPLNGQLTGTFGVEGDPRELTGKAQGKIDNFSVYDLSFETTTFEGTADHGKAHFAVSLSNGDLPAQIDLNLDPTMHFVASTEMNAFDVRRLIKALPNDLRATTSLSLNAQGELASPKTIQAQSTISLLKFDWRELHIEPRRPLQVTYRNSTLHFDDVLLSGHLFEGAIKGSASLDGPLDLEVTASGDLSGVGSVLPLYEAARGPFEMNLALEGTVAEPEVLGLVRVKDAQVYIRSLDQEAKQLNTEILFRGRSLHDNAGSLKFGDGDLRFSGLAEFPRHRPPEYSFNATFKSIAVNPIPYMNVVASGELYLHGPNTDLALTGRVQLDSLRYTRNLQLEGLIPKRDAAPIKVTALSDRPAVKFNVNIDAKNNVLITNNVLEAELQLDLMLTGTSDRVGLIGSATPLWARAHYRDNIFTVDRAAIDFVEEYRVHTQFDVQARTLACGMQVSVNLQGDSDRYGIVPTGLDENGVVSPQDVLACLQFGLRLQDFEGPNAASLSKTIPGGLDALWTVSGLDEKVRKLLPIRVDELRLTSRWSSLSKTTTVAVVVGREIGKDLELKYTRSLEELGDQVLSLEYHLSRVATAQGTWASNAAVPIGDFGLDMRLRWELR